jgi:hypothetical protein
LFQDTRRLLAGRDIYDTLISERRLPMSLGCLKMLENWNAQHFYRVPHFTSPFTDNEAKTAASSYRNRKKLLHSSCKDQKWSNFVSYISDLQVNI